jgi:hypothetical protein
MTTAYTFAVLDTLIDPIPTMALTVLTITVTVAIILGEPIAIDAETLGTTTVAERAMVTVPTASCCGA